MKIGTAIRTIFAVAISILSVNSVLQAQMVWPYSSSALATSMSGDGLSVTATATSSTPNPWGHTASISVTLRSPSGSRSASSTGPYGGTSYAYAVLPLCVGTTCEDGDYVAQSSGTEYCPLTPGYRGFGSLFSTQQVSPFVYMISVDFYPTSIARQNADSTLTTRAGKSPNCQASGVTIAANFAKPQGMLATITPSSQQNGAVFSGLEGSTTFTFHTNNNNQVSGFVDGSAYIYSVFGCTNKGDTPKTANPRLTVQ